MNVGIIQIGLRRHQTSALITHHQDFYNKLKSRFTISIYDFYRNSPDPECTYTNSNEIQLYDFLKHTEQIKEDIVLKIRSDIFLTNTAQEVICDLLEKVCNYELDLCFIGYDGHFGTEKKFAQAEGLLKKKKVVDHIIIGRKNIIPTDLNFISKLKNDKIKSGNTGFYHLINHNIKYASISTQIYVVRKDYDSLNQYDILLDWVTLYPNKWKNQIHWIKKNKDIIRSF